jgi:hypothetical protein
MEDRQKINRRFLVEQGYLSPVKRGRKPIYHTPEEAVEAKVMRCRLANAMSYQRFKEARTRYLETLNRDMPSEPPTDEPCTS